MATTLEHGCYGQPVPDGIHQHKYAGGGHPGCGGYIEALELEAVSGSVFVIQEYRDDRPLIDDTRIQRFRWRLFDDGITMLDAWKDCLSFFKPNREGFSKWHSRPFWECVNYNNWPDEYMQPFEVYDLP